MRFWKYIKGMFDEKSCDNDFLNQLSDNSQTRTSNSDQPKESNEAKTSPNNELKDNSDEKKSSSNGNNKQDSHPDEKNDDLSDSEIADDNLNNENKNSSSKNGSESENKNSQISETKDSKALNESENQTSTPGEEFKENNNANSYPDDTLADGANEFENNSSCQKEESKDLKNSGNLETSSDESKSSNDENSSMPKSDQDHEESSLQGKDMPLISPMSPEEKDSLSQNVSEIQSQELNDQSQASSNDNDTENPKNSTSSETGKDENKTNDVLNSQNCDANDASSSETEDGEKECQSNQTNDLDMSENACQTNESDTNSSKNNASNDEEGLNDQKTQEEKKEYGYSQSSGENESSSLDSQSLDKNTSDQTGELNSQSEVQEDFSADEQTDNRNGNHGEISSFDEQCEEESIFPQNSLLNGILDQIIGEANENEYLSQIKGNHQEKNDPEKSDMEQKKYLLEKLKEAIANYRDNKIREEMEKYRLHGDEVLQELEGDEAPQKLGEDEVPQKLGENANQFLGRLDTLPPFDQREKSQGYSIDTESKTVVDEIIIKNLINKFLNQQFCNQKEDLNVRNSSLEKSRGFLKWEVKDVIVHLETEQLTKVLHDKYGYDYSKGKNEFVPLSFYFDLSGSMSNYTNMLATVAIELLKKDVKVLIGTNEEVEVQIDSLDKEIRVKELAEFLINPECKNHKIKYRSVQSNIDNYLINRNAEKVCVFADFDPLKEVCNLSHNAQVYWFCFEKSYKLENLTDYDGFVYPVCDLNTIAEGLKKVNAQRFKALVYTENPKQLRKVLK